MKKRPAHSDDQALYMENSHEISMFIRNSGHSPVMREPLSFLSFFIYAASVCAARVSGIGSAEQTGIADPAFAECVFMRTIRRLSIFSETPQHSCSTGQDAKHLLHSTAAIRRRHSFHSAAH